MNRVAGVFSAVYRVTVGLGQLAAPEGACTVS